MKKLITLLLVLSALILTPVANVKASSYLDRIDKYEITIDPNKDGTLDKIFYVRQLLFYQNLLHLVRQHF